MFESADHFLFGRRARVVDPAISIETDAGPCGLNADFAHFGVVHRELQVADAAFGQLGQFAGAGGDARGLLLRELADATLGRDQEVSYLDAHDDPPNSVSLRHPSNMKVSCCFSSRTATTCPPGGCPLADTLVTMIMDGNDRA